MICKIANTISRPISVQSFTQPARLRADGPTSPRSTQGGWLTHDQLLQWVWGPEKTGHPWLVHLVRIEPILRAYLGSQATSGRLPHLPSLSAYYPVTTHQRLCVPTRHTTGIERPWCVDRLPSHISKMVVSTVCVGGPCKTELRTCIFGYMREFPYRAVPSAADRPNFGHGRPPKSEGRRTRPR